MWKSFAPALALTMSLALVSLSGCSDSEATEDGGVPDAFIPVDAAVTPDAGSAPDAGGGRDASGPADASDAGTPADPCTVANGGCDLHATCTSTTGSAVCRCLPGYVGDGETCDDVVASLSGLRWSLPCTSGDNGNHVCDVAGATETSTTVSGTAGEVYAVTLRFRGVVEQKSYVDGKNDGAYLQTGGAPAGDGFNVYSLQISDPPSIHYLNRGTSSIYYCFPIDYTATFPMATGATITLRGDPLDGAEIQNVDVAGAPIIVPDLAPAPAAYDGQFIQMDVLRVQTGG